ncbi:hypothetical protein Ocin01_19074 [Orchesella cincta]|uniref:Uncharacterized protein n=1 Tax=Orchesella cincta TaxID=48709 RepID=A0A1D2M3R7_ORCCI|nr:hypothetical protein Ocin01_19074 [Orchesella cincta]
MRRFKKPHQTMSRRLSRSRTSLHRLHPRSYTVSNDKVVYIHEPRRDYIEYHDSRILRKRQSERRSCINRLCVGVCNFFNRVKAKERNHKDNSYPPPAICYVPSRSRTLRPRGRTPRTAAHAIDRPLTRMSYDALKGILSYTSQDSLVEMPTWEAMYNANVRAGYEPIIIRTCHSERCAECSSRMITATKEKCGSPNTYRSHEKNILHTVLNGMSVL